MRLYVFNHTKGYETHLAVAIVSETKEQAVGIYENATTNRQYEVEEHEITNGLMIFPEGYDNTAIFIGHAEED